MMLFASLASMNSCFFYARVVSKYASVCVLVDVKFRDTLTEVYSLNIAKTEHVCLEDLKAAEHFPE